MAQSVSWSTASAVAKQIAKRFPSITSYELAELRDDFDELIPQAESLVSELTGLSSPFAAKALVVERAGWIDANLKSYQRILESVKGGILNEAPIVGMDHLAGVQVGALIGYISSRVLGQYDLIFGSSEAETGGSIYFVGSNLVALERNFGFPKKQFRLWVALHEMTHRFQFEAISWLKPTFSELVSTMLEVKTPTASDFINVAIRVFDSIKDGKSPIPPGGLAELLASKEQADALEKITVLMSIAEGHGDWVMNRAAKEEIPEAYRFHSLLSTRRTSASGVAKVLGQLLGLEAKMKQYEVGEKFIEAIEAQSPGAIDDLFAARENLPTLAELAEPTLWLSRVKGVGLK